MATGKRRYDLEYKRYHSKPEQRKRRAARNRARRIMTKKLGKAAVLGKDIDHKSGNALNNSTKNLRVMSKKRNRGFKRNSKGKNLGVK
mgnify:FL=1